MLTDEILIEKAKKLVEASSGWGDSIDWTNSDFIALSEKIRESTGVSLSHVTLKRLWGKVKYDSLPNTHTLDTLVQFAGYENWRQFKLKDGNGTLTTPLAVNDTVEIKPVIAPALRRHRPRFLKNWMVATVVIIIALPCLLFFIPVKKERIDPADYHFNSKKVVSVGLPNTVVFDYDATKAPYDSVIIQQSWDVTRQVTVSKNDHQHTAIYYYPDYYQAKLIVGNKIVQRHNLLIKSDGWSPVIMQPDVPVYLTREEVMTNGTMTVTPARILAHNVPMQPVPPTVFISNVQDFGEIYSDDFVFETALKNDYHEGAAACQVSRVYLLCENRAIWIPLSAKGCVSTADLRFTDYIVSGRQQDLSAFGVDFSKFVKLRIECKNGKAQIYVDDKLAYTVTSNIAKAKIIGIDYSFRGCGTVDYVRLSNSKVHFDDEF